MAKFWVRAGLDNAEIRNGIVRNLKHLRKLLWNSRTKEWEPEIEEAETAHAAFQQFASKCWMDISEETSWYGLVSPALSDTPDLRQPWTVFHFQAVPCVEEVAVFKQPDLLADYAAKRAANAGKPDGGHKWVERPLVVLGKRSKSTIGASEVCANCQTFRRSNGNNRPCVGRVKAGKR